MTGLGYVRLGDHHVITGHVLDALKKIPDGKVQVCVTSPPYFGLRSYGTEPQVWGGLPDCAHEWGAESLRKGPAQKQGATSQRNGRSNVEAQIQRDVSEGTYCIRCEAWRGELGQEPTPGLFVAHLVEIFCEVRRVLRDDGVLFVNLGDSYNNRSCARKNGNRDVMGNMERGVVLPTWREMRANGTAHMSLPDVREKSLLLVPQRFVLAMSDDGWIVRDEIVWAKKSCMPESVRDRCTKSWEPIFMFTKSPRYYWDAEAVKTPVSPKSDFSKPRPSAPMPSSLARPGDDFEHYRKRLGNGSVGSSSGANLRNVWHLGPEPYAKAHFATFPTEIPRRCIKAASRPGDLVLDPFAGSGRTAKAAMELGRRSVMIELNPEYVGYIREQVAR